MSGLRIIAAAAALQLALCAAAEAVALPPTAPACAQPPANMGRARERGEANLLMAIAKELEDQGEANFHLKYARPTKPCLVETFPVGDALVAGEHNAQGRGLSSLLYRFIVARPGGSSEVLFLYSGTASMVAGGDLVFHVSEERDGVISWYALYATEPGYEHAKALVERIVRGEARPLMSVTWPKGAARAGIVELDKVRLR